MAAAGLRYATRILPETWQATKHPQHASSTPCTWAGGFLKGWRHHSRTYSMSTADTTRNPHNSCTPVQQLGAACTAPGLQHQQEQLPDGNVTRREAIWTVSYNPAHSRLTTNHNHNNQRLLLVPLLNDQPTQE
jgi:hypothetical protein